MKEKEVERLEKLDELRGENTKRTFFVDNPSPEGERLVILSFAKEKVVVKVAPKVETPAAEKEEKAEEPKDKE